MSDFGGKCLGNLVFGIGSSILVRFFIILGEKNRFEPNLPQ